MVTQVLSLTRSGLADFVIQRVTAVILAAYTFCLVGFFLSRGPRRVLLVDAYAVVQHSSGAVHRHARVDWHVDHRHRLPAPRTHRQFRDSHSICLPDCLPGRAVHLSHLVNATDLAVLVDPHQ